MSEVSNTPEGKVTVEAEAWLTAQGYHETVNAPQGDFADKSNYKTISPTFGFKTVARLLSDFAALQSADLNRQLESAREETTIYREEAERVKEQNKTLAEALEERDREIKKLAHHLFSSRPEATIKIESLEPPKTNEE